VVGFSTTSTGEYRAFIWDKVNKMRDLNSASLTPNKATFAYLRDACGITDNGYIVGTGQTVTSKGKTYIHAFLLTPKP
jgi:probable HAF family extracellular repeat protein